MRTTLTLDDDVAIAIERRRRQLDHTLKEEVNGLLRAGLAQVEGGRQQRALRRFRVEPFDAGELLIDIADVSAALDIAEGPWHR
jgi:hypothetical protein